MNLPFTPRITPPTEPVAAASVPRDDPEVLRLLVEGTVRATGERFFAALVRHLAAAVERYAGRHALAALGPDPGDAGVRVGDQGPHGAGAIHLRAARRDGHG